MGELRGWKKLTATVRSNTSQRENSELLELPQLVAKSDCSQEVREACVTAQAIKIGIYFNVD